MKIIKSYQKYNNNIYLSATIDKIDGFDYYTKDVRDMIDQKYLCDYNIKIPIFSEDPTNKNICEYLIKNYRNIIIYCNSQKEGRKINELMNNIRNNCSKYIDCSTNKKDRNEIIKKYKSGDLPFLINVRILVEGFDAPITKGICFMHLPSSKTTLIQIIGRALRLHEDKNLANIILPFSNKSDEDNINKFLKVMARNDSRIRKSYINKKLGGYINFDKIEDNINNGGEKDIELKYELIFDKIGILKNADEIWEKKLEEVKKYIDNNKKRPSSTDKNKDIKQLGIWISNQQKNYAKQQHNMKDDNIRNKWEQFTNDIKYKKYFLSNEQEWDINLVEVKKYIDNNKKRPSTKDKNKDIKNLGQWISNQQINYAKQQKIMKDDNIRNKWKQFIEDPKYKKYFLSNEQEWDINLVEVKKYIDDNKKRPSDKNKDIKNLGQWISNQQRNYAKQQQIMKDDNIRKKWKQFIEDPKYSKYFLSNEQEWDINLVEVKKYIDDNKKRPSKHDKNKDIKNLGQWISHQQHNYKKQQHNMKDDNIRNKWEQFTNDIKYKKYFN